jgi:putative hydrolase of the HAD superfamily
VRALFCDLGGCFLSNAWDHAARRRACEKFGIDPGRFEVLHAAAAEGFEKGSLTLAEYLARTVFAAGSPAAVSAQEFTAFMKSCSRKLGDALDVLADFRREHPVRCVVLNNESRELNDFRIDTFGLRERFDAFFSSCYLGLRKPEAAIYWLAVQVTGARPQESLLIDDREENLRPAADLGMQTFLFDPVGLARRLRAWSATPSEAAGGP